MAKQPPDNLTGAYPLAGNLYIQAGSSGFTGTLTDASDMSIRTNLTAVECAVISCDDTYGSATGTEYSAGVNIQNLAIERVVSSGAVTVTRSTTAAAAGEQKFSYILIGTQDDTN